MTKRLIDHGEATCKKTGLDPGASNLEPEVRISSRPGWQNQPTDQRPDTFTQAKTSPRDLQPRGGPYIFESSSFIAAASSICSARSFFSFAFSSSSALSRLASETVIPPNFAFHA